MIRYKEVREIAGEYFVCTDDGRKLSRGYRSWEEASFILKEHQRRNRVWKFANEQMRLVRR